LFRINIIEKKTLRLEAV